MKEHANKKRTILATVVSTAMQKSAVVVIERNVESKVGKRIRRTTRMQIHDPEDRCKVGDEVSIVQIAPQSKNKCWQLVEVTKSVENTEAQ